MYDREIDWDYLKEIMAYYDIKDKVQPLEGPEQVQELLAEVQDNV